jgi:hypothetical protein
MTWLVLWLAASVVFCLGFVVGRSFCDGEGRR